MAKKIEISLNSKSIKDGIRQLKEYQAEVVLKTKLLAEKLAEKGVEMAKLKIREFDAIYTGELLASIEKTPGGVIENGSTWYVYTGCPWAKFVEFGTGIVGAQNRHEAAGIVGWKYDVNSHGEKGWFYFRENEWHWTKGMPSRPFMYETAAELTQIVAQAAKEVFGNG